MVKTRVIKIRVIEGPNVHDQIAFCAFHSSLVEVQTKAGLHTCNACIITTWRLGLWAPLVTRDYFFKIFTKWMRGYVVTKWIRGYLVTECLRIHIFLGQGILQLSHE